MDTHPDTLSRLARPHRKSVLTALLWITIGGGLLLAFLNAQRNTWELAALQLGMVAYSGFLLFIIRDTRHLERWTLSFALVFFAVIVTAVATPTAHPTDFSWVLLVPVMSHLLLGRRTGLMVSVAIIATTGTLFLFRFGDNPLMMDPRAGANIILLTVCMLLFSHVYEVSRERSELRLLHMAQTDFLTGLPNRSRLKVFFEREKRRASREQQPLSLLVIDLDHFKLVNDRYGHEAGDRALVFFADLLNGRLRTTDLAGRLGGEEFGVILPNTSITAATIVAEELRRALQRAKCEHEGEIMPLTMSIGVAELGVDGTSLQELLSAADQRLYQAKDEGRNRVVPTPGIVASPNLLHH